MTLRTCKKCGEIHLFRGLFSGKNYDENKCPYPHFEIYDEDGERYTVYAVCLEAALEKCAEQIDDDTANERWRNNEFEVRLRIGEQWYCVRAELVPRYIAEKEK